MNDLNREEIIYRLRSIVRQLTCMNNEEFESSLSHNRFDMKIDHFGFNEKSKTITTIVMIKKEVEQ